MKTKAELIAQAEILEWADDRAGLICIAERAAELRAQASQVPEQEPVSHTDHPSRHWDRTCPACNTAADGPTREAGRDYIPPDTSAVGVPDCITYELVRYTWQDLAKWGRSLDKETPKGLGESLLCYSDDWRIESNQAAEALTALQDKVTIKSTHIANLNDHIAQQAATIKEMRELLEKVNEFEPGTWLTDIAAFLERTK